MIVKGLEKMDRDQSDGKILRNIVTKQVLS